MFSQNANWRCIPSKLAFLLMVSHEITFSKVGWVKNQKGFFCCGFHAVPQDRNNLCSATGGPKGLISGISTVLQSGETALKASP